MKKVYRWLPLSLLLSICFLCFSLPAYASEKVDVTTGWEIDFHTNLSNIDVNTIFLQGCVNEQIGQEYTLNNFANIGDAQVTATKKIALKKGYSYKFDLLYAMSFSNGSGYIDFDGERFVSDSDDSDRTFTKEMDVTNDTFFTITLHYDVRMKSIGYLKLGNLQGNPGIEGLKTNAQAIVHYVDDNGVELQPSVTLTGKERDPYASEKKDIPDFTFEKVVGEATGTFSEDVKEISYVYKKNDVKESQVIVHYLDETGKQLQPDFTLTGKEGTPYTAEKKDMPGFSFEKVIGEETGVFTREPKEISYVYKKKTVAEKKVIVRYVDEAGNELIPAITLTGSVNAPYQSEAKVIEGYSLKQKPENCTGVFTGNTQEVIYTYVKNDSVGKRTENVDTDSRGYSGKKLPATGEKTSKVSSGIGSILLVASLNYLYIKKISKR